MNVALWARVAQRTAELTATNQEMAQSREALRRISARLQEKSGGASDEVLQRWRRG